MFSDPDPVEPEVPAFNEVSTVKAKEGENVVLPCVAGGSPPPDVRFVPLISSSLEKPAPCFIF
jgi:hypothetical protein